MARSLETSPREASRKNTAKCGRLALANATSTTDTTAITETPAGAAVLLDGATLFATAPDGPMPWRGRPDALKHGLVARTPPFEVIGEDR
jgi:predicted metal-binding protein